MKNNIKIVTEKKKAAALKKKMAKYTEAKDKVMKNMALDRILKLLLGATESRSYVINSMSKYFNPVEHRTILEVINRSKELDKKLEETISKFSKDYQESIIQLGKLETELAKEVEEAKEEAKVK